MFAHRRRARRLRRSREIAFLYGATGLGLGVADLLVGSVERLGQHDPDRAPRRDDDPAGAAAGAGVRRRVRAAPARPDHPGARSSSAWALHVVRRLDAGAGRWSPCRCWCAASADLLRRSSSAFSCIQFWTTDATEVANAFTYGGNTMTQYPLTDLPARAGQGADLPAPAGLRELVPLPLRPRPSRPVRPAGVAAVRLAGRRRVVLCAVPLLVWRTGVRHYTSTGS